MSELPKKLSEDADAEALAEAVQRLAEALRDLPEAERVKRLNDALAEVGSEHRIVWPS